MKISFLFKIATFFFAIVLCMCCQKELDGTIIGNGGGGTSGIPPAVKKPGLGTTWTYRFYSYYPNGQILSSQFLVYKAVSEELYGGETWLNIADTSTFTTVYLLKAKPDGLHQYTNNNDYLFLKDPAVLNESYTTYNDGSDENITVKRIQDSMLTNLGKIAVNYYEGKKGTDIIHDIWYNENYWMVKHFTYFRNLSGVYYRRYAMFLLEIRY